MTGFPEFGQFYFAGFPASTQVGLKSAASAIPPRPHAPPSIGGTIRRRSGTVQREPGGLRDVPGTYAGLLAWPFVMSSCRDAGSASTHHLTGVFVVVRSVISPARSTFMVTFVPVGRLLK